MRKTVSSILDSTYFKFLKYDDNNNPQYEVVVNLPVEPWRDIFNKHGRTLGTFLQNKFSLLQENLNKVNREINLKKQCEILSNDVFGGDFPVPEDDWESSNKKFKEAGFIASPQGA